MARKTPSPWRQRSRRAIMNALAIYRMNHPPPWDRAEERAAISAAYPFGERKHHPYRMWLAEVKHVLGPARPGPPARVRIFPAGVACGWCKDPERGCLACLPTWWRWRAVQNWDPWYQWLDALAAAPEDTDLMGVFSDWLEEQGFADQAALYRQDAAQLKAGFSP